MPPLERDVLLYTAGKWDSLSALTSQGYAPDSPCRACGNMGVSWELWTLQDTRCTLDLRVPSQPFSDSSAQCHRYLSCKGPSYIITKIVLNVWHAHQARLKKERTKIYNKTIARTAHAQLICSFVFRPRPSILSLAKRQKLGKGLGIGLINRHHNKPPHPDPMQLLLIYCSTKTT